MNKRLKGTGERNEIMETTSLRMPTKLKQRVYEMAEKCGVTPSDYIRWVLENKEPSEEDFEADS